MARTVRVQPVAGKFVKVDSNGRSIRIYLVDPKTMKQGTEVSYEDAITLLAMKSNVVCLSQEKGPDGKFIQQFTEEDWNKVREEHEKVMNQISANTLQAPDKADSTLKTLVETQAELIKSQNNNIAMMQAQMLEMQKQMQEFMKTAKKGKAAKDSE